MTPMCRSIKVLREGATPAPTEEIEAAALQFVRKISGFSKPAHHNEEVFNQAVLEISEASMRLLDGSRSEGQRRRSGRRPFPPVRAQGIGLADVGDTWDRRLRRLSENRE